MISKLEASGTFDALQYPVHSLQIEGCVYRGEGNANLVIALPSEHKVIRLRKSPTSLVSKEEDEKAAFRRVCREVDFIRGVISGFLGCYVSAPEILRLDPTEIARLADKIRPIRPENRRNKEIIGGYATKYPDYTFLSQELMGFSSKSTFCVEIKPKQGFICKADRQLKKCPYCLTQYYKVRNKSIKEPSAYCPLDLFSGNPVRMGRALKELLHSPQNNFKIFRNGEVVYKENTDESILNSILTEWFSNDNPKVYLEKFIHLIIQALTYPFDAENDVHNVDIEEEEDMVDIPCRLKPELLERVKELIALDEKECELSDVGNLMVGSVLERIFRMQKLHRYGADLVTWIYARFSASLGIDDQLIYGFKTNPQAEVTMEKEQTIDSQFTNESFLEKFTIGDCITILKNYLLFCTARDCSILMAFQEVDKTSPENISVQHQIDLSEDQSFLVSIRILDLDMKSINCIEKHHCRDNDVLQATIEELEKKIFANQN